MSRTNNENFEVPIDNVYQKFEKHFNYPNNKRILFSGEYGIGKTYFLNKFFKKQGVDYIIISPLKYITSHNEDIFELIKVDILFQLFEKNLISFEEEFKFDSSSLFYWYLVSEPLSIANVLLPYLNKIDAIGDEFQAGVTAIATISASLKRQLNRFKQTYESKVNKNNQVIIDFAKSFNLKKGSPYEFDIVTQFINQILLNMETNKNCSLIIDDLDRLDPEHIFRILNILSVHNNYIGVDNKFNFAKIILVCDINNIKHIFHHKYGERVDFKGYIDKFYSTDIYKYTNDDAIEFYLNNGVRTSLDERGELILKFLLKQAIRSKVLTLRQLIKFKYFETSSIESFTLKTIEFDEDLKHICTFISPNLNTLEFQSNDLSILGVIKCLTLIWGDFDLLESNLDQMISSHSKKNVLNVSYEQVECLMFDLILLDRLEKMQDHQLFFNIKHGHRDQYADWPEGMFRGMKYRLILRWNKDNPYKGVGNYFNIRKLNIPNYNFTSIMEILESVKEVISFLKSKSYIKYLNISE